MSELPLIDTSPATEPPAGSTKAWVINLFLQISQRLGAIALFATLGSWAMLYLAKDTSIPIAITVATGNIGMCAALVARMLTTRGSKDRREANGIAIFNLVLLAMALHLMLYTRLDVIRSAAAEFFTPVPAPVETVR